jgi:putative transposase
MSRAERRCQIERDHPHLSLTRQCQLVSISRSSFYYQPREEPALNRALRRRIDELYLESPFFGSRQMTYRLRREGFPIGRKRVRRLMRTMGLTAVYARPRTSQPEPGHRIYPYQLRDLTITEPDHVWCADVTYIPIESSHLYLVAVMDWATRAVLSWRLSNTLDASFCVDALEEALERHGPPEIFNTDQGCQFTSEAFTGVLERHGVMISMDGRGRWLDNVFIERLWRSLKWECVYLAEWTDGRQARAGIRDWMTFYNHQRPHAVHDGESPGNVYGLPGCAMESDTAASSALRWPPPLGNRFAVPTAPTAPTAVFVDY